MASGKGKRKEGGVRAPKTDPELCALSNRQKESNGNTVVFLYDLSNLTKVHRLISTDIQVHTHACLMPKVPLLPLCCRGEATATGLIALCSCPGQEQCLAWQHIYAVTNDAGQADEQLLHGFPSFPVEYVGQEGKGDLGNS